MNIKVLGIDPGNRTGVCLLRAMPSTYEVALARTLDYTSRFDLYRILLEEQPHVVVIEDFKIYPHAARKLVLQNLPAVHVIGAVEMAMHLQQTAQTLHYQMASAIGRVQIPDEHRALLSNEHMRDAYKHARLFLLTQLNYDPRALPLPTRSD